VRSAAEIQEVRRLKAAGYSHAAIARTTGIPRSTVRDWLNGSRYTPVGRAPFREGLRLDRLSYAYLLGMYLGDGHISRLERTFRLRVFQDSRHPGIVGEIVQAIRRLGLGASGHRVSPHNLVIVSSYSQYWPALVPQHGPGVKHERSIELVDWQREITASYPREFIRGLIHSDGSRFINPVRHGEKLYTYPRYHFSNVSEDIKRLFCEHLDLLGIAWRKATHKNISIARREAVAALDAFVGPKY
jgi:hypothetical protein